MATRLTREQLHALVWKKPMTRLAAELGLSDVGLRKACHRHDVPTPPAGWWAKRAYGKATPIPPLPTTRPAEEVVSVQGGPAEAVELSTARAAVRERLELTTAEPARSPIVEHTFARLEKLKSGRDELKRLAGPGLVTVAVRPSSRERAAQLLRALIAATTSAGIELAKVDGESAAFRCDGETVGFELVEVPDRVEHVATAKELAAVEKWTREREERHAKYGYWADYGRPYVPKWEDQYNGRLAIRLEAVRARSDDDWWGKQVTRTFTDTRTRDVLKLVPRMVEAVAVIAAAKRSNRALAERQRIAAEEAARRRAEEERRRQLEERQGKLLDQLVIERTEVDRLAALVGALRATSGDDPPPRVARLLGWAASRLAAAEGRLAAGALEERLAKAGLFGDDAEPVARGVM
jgi:hypothetical protein